MLVTPSRPFSFSVLHLFSGAIRCDFGPFACFTCSGLEHHRSKGDRHDVRLRQARTVSFSCEIQYFTGLKFNISDPTFQCYPPRLFKVYIDLYCNKTSAQRQVEIFRDFPFDEFDIQVINVEATCSVGEGHKSWSSVSAAGFCPAICSGGRWWFLPSRNCHP